MRMGRRVPALVAPLCWHCGAYGIVSADRRVWLCSRHPELALRYLRDDERELMQAMDRAADLRLIAALYSE
jgi:hypothetical protein